MANAIKDPPNRYDFGEAFNYAVWPRNTSLTLTNVKWNNDYRDVVRFPNQGALDDYIDGRSGNTQILNTSQHKFGTSTVRVNTPINVAMQHNYLRASNPINPVQGDIRRNYYYFILDVQYIAGNTTQLTVQLDMWQTYIYEVTLGNCYIERGHISIANEHALDNYGRDYLNVPEGLDVGGEYRIVKTASEDVMTIDTYSVLVISTADFTKGPGTVKNPRLITAPGSVVDGLISGASFYVFPTPDDYLKFQRAYAAFPWITQSVVHVTAIPPVGRYNSTPLLNVSGEMWVGNGQSFGPDDPIPDLPDWTVYTYPKGQSQPKNTALAPNWRDTLLNALPAAYRGLKKFLTYPYCMVELTTWAGQPLVIRPEAWADPDATVRELAVMVPPGQRIAFMPFRYNGDGATTPGATDDNAESLDFATTLSNFPSVPIVNNMAIGYLAANRAGIAFQRQSADWSQQRALMGAQAMSDNTDTGIANTARQSSIANTAQTSQAAISAMASANQLAAKTAVNAVGMITETGGGFLAAGANAAATGIAANAALDSSNVGVQARGESTLSSIQASGAIRDTNMDLARRAAKGNYQNEIAGINAKVQDVMLTQPSTSGQFGGDAMNLAHNKAEVSARFKLLDTSAVRRIGNFWLRYGYAVGQFGRVPDDFMCMSKFTYWKLSETYISQARIPEAFKQGIRGIFEKGVTVWASPADIGTIDLSDNTPKSGISY